MKKIYYVLFILTSLLLISVSCSDSDNSSNNPVSPDVEIKYKLSVTVDPTEAGTVSPTTGEYNSGDSVEITASANGNWVFEGWQGDHTGTANPASVTMSSDKDIAALFIERTYPLTVNTEGEGTVNERVVQAKTTDYPEGTIVELTANPAEGWRFSHWEGDAETDENPIEIVIEEAKEVTAVFLRRDCPLSITIEGEGTVSEEIVQAKSTDYPFETVVELTANPANGWVFSHWEGDISGDENPVRIEIDDVKEVTAVFEIGYFTISYSIEGEGSVSEVLQTGEVNAEGLYEYESTVELTAEASEGWTFVSWDGDLQGTDNPSMITVDSDKEVTAIFERRDYDLTIAIEGEGTVTEEIVQAKTASYPYETNVQLTATPSEGWVFARWEGDLTGSENPAQIVIDGAKEVTAVFREPFYLHENGVTVMCPDADIGDSAAIFGVTYTKRNRDQITPDNAANTCTSGITDMQALFASAGSFNGDIGSWDVSSVTNMIYMFYQSEFNQPIGDWDVSNVTDMSGMFSGLNSEYTRFNQPIGEWDVSNVTDMSGMFSSSLFNQHIGDWDVSNVTSMSGMFMKSIFNKPIGNWDVNSVENMNSMFLESIFDLPIGDWDVINVTNMEFMFDGSQFNQHIGNWNVSNVTKMKWMFQRSKFNQPIGNWKVGNVEDMSLMFDLSPFNQSIGEWNVSNVINMSNMFSNSSFNHPIGNWDVSNVHIMNSMFRNSPFNQNISEWCVTNIQTEPPSFSSLSPLSPENKPVWGTCPG